MPLVVFKRKGVIYLNKSTLACSFLFHSPSELHVGAIRKVTLAVMSFSFVGVRSYLVGLKSHVSYTFATKTISETPIGAKMCHELGTIDVGIICIFWIDYQILWLWKKHRLAQFLKNLYGFLIFFLAKVEFEAKPTFRFAICCQKIRLECVPNIKKYENWQPKTTFLPGKTVST